MIDFSVVVPVHNTNPSWLRDAVVSVLTQDRASFELILVDDGSTDPRTLAELEWCRQARGNQAVTLLSRMEVNVGVGAACQHALTLARGRWVSLLGSDDLMLPGRLARQRHILSRGMRFTSGQVLFSDGVGRVRGISHWEGRKCMGFTKRIFDPTVAFVRDDALAIGGFDIRKRVAEATDLWARWALYYGLERTCVSRLFWAIYRLHNRSLSYGRRGPRHLNRWRTG